jgi:hypothetical protein
MHSGPGIMSEKEKKKKAGLGRISRREFTISSMAVIGATPLIPDVTAEEATPFKLDKPDYVHTLMEERHILDDDLIQVIDQAEKTGRKLYQADSDRFMAKLRIQETYFYAEYSPIEGGYRIYNTYSHRFDMEEGI